MLYIVLFLHQTTTLTLCEYCPMMLYIVLFLHQTTTVFLIGILMLSCISYYSYIKPQPGSTSNTRNGCCISYYSYIKPQLTTVRNGDNSVVYRTIPTSNHNQRLSYVDFDFVVYRTIPTSNHNLYC